MENCMKYMLFPFSDGGTREDLEIIAADYISYLTQYIASYIWQCDSFNLAVAEGAGTGLHLEGSTCYGDNVEDEWFIVFLLLQLTKKEQNLIVKVEDDDGEFLLIEAADHIPKWLDPETSENRVFLYRGSLHVIPIAQNPGHITPIPSGVPSVLDAVAAVRKFTKVTKSSTSVQQAIQRRIECYPEKIREFQHKAHCYVPAGVAAVLKEEPHLLSAAVRAFYYRTPLELKSCSAMRYFPPETRVMTEVLFSRCLYAQLVSQHYVPERRIGWNMPPVNHPNFKAYDLGMKLACGFEILASGCPQSPDTEKETIRDCDFSKDRKWIRFLKSLTEKSYFRGEIEGSKLYNELLHQAKNFYIHSLSEANASEKQCPGDVVMKLLNTVNINYEELKAVEQNLSPPDDDNWLYVTPDELDSMLATKSGSGGKEEKKLVETIAGTLNSFLHHASDIEGAEFPTNISKKEKEKVNLDPDAFSDAFKNILDFRIPDNDDDKSSSSMSSYSCEDDSDVELDESGASGLRKVKSDTCDILTSMKSYMEQMDRELAATDVGKSFERVVPNSNNLQEASEKSTNSLDESTDIDQECDEFNPVDVDLTVVKNILDSYASQQGLPGPASNLFSSMGMNLSHSSKS